MSVKYCWDSQYRNIWIAFILLTHEYWVIQLKSCIVGDRPFKLEQKCIFIEKSFPCKGLALCLLHTWTGTYCDDDHEKYGWWRHQFYHSIKGLADQPWFGLPVWSCTSRVGDLLPVGSGWEGEIFCSEVRILIFSDVHVEDDGTIEQ